MDEDRPDLGRNCTMANETSSQSNEDALQDRTSVVSLPKESIDEINAHFVNTLYGFPVGKRLAFPMVDNYVKHAWMKFGLNRVMMHHGFFMFQFESKSGMDKVIEGGPWRIQLVPIILKIWKPNTLLLKDKNKSRNDWLNDFEKTTEANVGEHSLNAVGLIIELIHESALVNATVFDGLIELSKDERKTGEIGLIWCLRIEFGGFGEDVFVTAAAGRGEERK
ncbi:zinc knuckle CX2CX4HX4C containing protein [Tanacetum coccineum]